MDRSQTQGDRVPTSRSYRASAASSPVSSSPPQSRPSPFSPFISPNFLRRMACTAMKPVVSVGANVSPISSMLLSVMSYSFSDAELRPSTLNCPAYTRQRTCPLTDT